MDRRDLLQHVFALGRGRLQHYGYDDGDPTKQFWKQQQTVWFDDVVVARHYIGPMAPAKF